MRAARARESRSLDSRAARVALRRGLERAAEAAAMIGEGI